MCCVLCDVVVRCRDAMLLCGVVVSLLLLVVVVVFVVVVVACVCVCACVLCILCHGCHPITFTGVLSASRLLPVHTGALRW